MSTSDAVVAGETVEVSARDYGGSGTGLVLVHGLSSNLAIWDLIGPRLARRFRVVAYDQRSHGLSTDGDGDYGFPALVSDLQAVIRHFDLDDPVVVGHSWGATVALSHAAVHPSCPGVVCVDGGVMDLQGLGRTWEQTEELLRPPRLVGPEQEILDRYKREQAYLPWNALEPVVRLGRVATEDGLTRPRLELDNHMKIVRKMWEGSTWDLYERIACPVMLVLAGGVERSKREQGFVAVKQTAADRLLERKRPGSSGTVRVEWLESVHDIPLANPAELASLIEGFVDGLVAAR